MTVLNFEEEKFARQFATDVDYLLWKKAQDKVKALIAADQDVDEKLLKEVAKYEVKLRTKAKAASKAKIDEALSDLDEDELKEARKQEIREKIVLPENLYRIRKLNKWISLNDNLDDPTNGSFYLVDGKLDNWKTYMPDFSHSDYDLLCELMIDENRTYRYLASTFKNTPSDTLNLVVKDFIQPKAGEHHPLFDVVIKSICGGKQDAIDHVEKIIVAKWHKPEDYLLPALVFDDNGGTGKNLFVGTILGTIFKERMVLQSSLSRVTGRFNYVIEGKAVVYIDEVQSSKKDTEDLKRILHSKHVPLERKGIDSQVAENTALYILSGNNLGVGTVRLAGTKVDRRFSVIKGGKDLAYHIMDWIGGDMKPDEADLYLKSEGQHILTDPEEAAKWLNHLVEKHGLVENLPAFHGKDYHDTLSEQADIDEQICEVIFRDPNFNYVRLPTLYELFKHLSPHDLTNKTFYARVNRWIDKSGLQIERKNAVYWGQSYNNQSIYILKDYDGKIDINDSKYYSEEYGKKTWKISI